MHCIPTVVCPGFFETDVSRFVRTSGGFISKIWLVESEESYSDWCANGNCITRVRILRGICMCTFLVLALCFKNLLIYVKYVNPFSADAQDVYFLTSNLHSSYLYL